MSKSDYPDDTSFYDHVRSRGLTSKYLEAKGFGWLMEVDDIDEDSQKPLL